MLPRPFSHVLVFAFGDTVMHSGAESIPPLNTCLWRRPSFSGKRTGGMKTAPQPLGTGPPVPTRGGRTCPPCAGWTLPVHPEQAAQGCVSRDGEAGSRERPLGGRTGIRCPAGLRDVTRPKVIVPHAGGPSLPHRRDREGSRCCRKGICHSSHEWDDLRMNARMHGVGVIRKTLATAPDGCQSPCCCLL